MPYFSAYAIAVVVSAEADICTTMVVCLSTATTITVHSKRRASGTQVMPPYAHSSYISFSAIELALQNCAHIITVPAHFSNKILRRVDTWAIQNVVSYTVAEVRIDLC